MKNEQTLYFATLFFGALKVADKGIVGRNKNVGVHIVFFTAIRVILIKVGGKQNKVGSYMFYFRPCLSCLPPLGGKSCMSNLSVCVLCSQCVKLIRPFMMSVSVVSMPGGSSVDESESSHW